MGQHTGLAGAGAGEDEQRAFAVTDGFALGIVEVREQPFGAIGAGLDRRSRRLVDRRRDALGLALKRHPSSIARDSAGLDRLSWARGSLPPLLRARGASC